MGALGQTYPRKPSFHFKKLGRKLFWILLIHIEVIVGWRKLTVRIVQVRFNVVRRGIGPRRRL